MFGYVLSNKEHTHKSIKRYYVKNFNTLSNDLNKNIFIVHKDKILYEKDILFYASLLNHENVLEWYKKSGYVFSKKFLIEHKKYNDMGFIDNSGTMIYGNYNKILKTYLKYVHVKKVIKWGYRKKGLKYVKFKTKNYYLKGYNKN